MLSSLNFTKISPNGTDWYINDELALRNFAKLAMESNETFSRAIFLHSKPIALLADASKRTEVGGTFGNIHLERTKLPKNVPAQV